MDEVVRVWQEGADQGNDGAQFALGCMFRDGNGVKQNYFEASKWYRKASDQGNARAQYALGVAFALGQGENQDYSEANKW